MDDELEEFSISADPATVEPSSQYEGTNASRFAVAGALGLVPESGSIAAESPVAPDTLEMFGFRRELALGPDNAPSDPVETVLGELDYMLRHFAQRPPGPETRRQSWIDFAVEGVRPARLCLLVSGLCSELERESVSAAVALWNSIPESFRIINEWNDPWVPWDEIAYRLRRQWRPPDGIRSYGQPFWADPFLWNHFDGPEAAEERPLAPLTWDGAVWRAISEDVVDGLARYRDWRTAVGTILYLALWRIRIAEASPDPISRQLAQAARLQSANVSDDEGNQGAERVDRGPTPPLAKLGEPPSTMLHGTWGWKGEWWYPAGDFFEHIRNYHRSGLYQGGQEFSWSGTLSETQRRTAGERFARWVAAAGGGRGLRTVFAHSYGGEVAARAINGGADIQELVLLSAPINQHHHAAMQGVPRVIDVRLQFDMVLTLAAIRKRGVQQRLPETRNVTRYVLQRSFWDHGASHSPRVWQDEDIARRVRL